MKRAERTPVGILGAGRLGQAMARTARRAGRPVVIANSRGPDTLTSVVATLGDGVSAATNTAATTSPPRTSSAPRAAGDNPEAACPSPLPPCPRTTAAMPVRPRHRPSGAATAAAGPMGTAPGSSTMTTGRSFSSAQSEWSVRGRGRNAPTGWTAAERGRSRAPRAGAANSIAGDRVAARRAGARDIPENRPAGSGRSVRHTPEPAASRGR